MSWKNLDWSTSVWSRPHACESLEEGHGLSCNLLQCLAGAGDGGELSGSLLLHICKTCGFSLPRSAKPLIEGSIVRGCRAHGPTPGACPFTSMGGVRGPLIEVINIH